MVTPAVSVIIPVYNTAPYLEECIESVLCQSWDDFELILVDDGSTDGSIGIAERYCLNDSRVTLIKSEHGGQGHARNIGLDHARGEYIAFIDSDDSVAADYLKNLRDGVESGEYDFSMMEVSWTRRKSHTMVRSREEAMRGLLYQKSSYASVCGKLFKRELFERERFREGILYEDLDLMARVLLRVARVILIDDDSYRYRKHAESTLGHFTEHRLDVLKVTAGIISLVGREMPHLLKGAYDRHLSASFNMLVLLAKEGETKRKEYDVCWQTIKSLRRHSLLNTDVRIKNKFGVLLSYAGRKIFVAVASMF